MSLWYKFVLLLFTGSQVGSRWGVTKKQAVYIFQPKADSREYHYPRSQSEKWGPWKRIRKFSCTVLRYISSRIFCNHLSCAWSFRCHRRRRMGSISFCWLQKRSCFCGTLRTGSSLRDKSNWEIIDETCFQLSNKNHSWSCFGFFIMTSIHNYLNFFCIRFNNCQSEACGDSERASLGSISSAHRFINGIWFLQIYFPKVLWFSIPTRNRNSQKSRWPSTKALVSLFLKHSSLSFIKCQKYWLPNKPEELEPYITRKPPLSYGVLYVPLSSTSWRIV